MANYGARQPNNTAYIKQFVERGAPGDYWTLSNILQPSLLVNVVIQKDLTVAGNIYGNLVVPSDCNLKQNIEDLNLLDCENIMKIKPKQYSIDNILHYGFIAQEVQEYFPRVVNGGNTLSLNYIEMIPLLLHKIHDLQRQIDEINAN